MKGKKIIFLVLIIVLVVFLVLAGTKAIPKIIEKNKEKALEKTQNEAYTLVLEYVEAKIANIESELNKEQSEETRQVIESSYKELVDFIFNGTKINDKLSSDIGKDNQKDLAKKIVKIDEKIEKKYPEYKNNLVSSTKYSYEFLTKQLQSGLTYVTENSETYDIIKESIKKYNEESEQEREEEEKRQKDEGNLIEDIFNGYFSSK